MPDCSKSLFDLTFGEASECFLQSPTATKIADNYHELLYNAANATIGQWVYCIAFLVWLPSLPMMILLTYRFLHVAYLKYVRESQFEHDKADMRTQARVSAYMLISSFMTFALIAVDGEDGNWVLAVMGWQAICGLGAKFLPPDWFGKRLERQSRPRD